MPMGTRAQAQNPTSLSKGEMQMPDWWKGWMIGLEKLFTLPFDLARPFSSHMLLIALIFFICAVATVFFVCFQVMRVADAVIAKVNGINTDDFSEAVLADLKAGTRAI